MRMNARLARARGSLHHSGTKGYIGERYVWDWKEVIGSKAARIMGLMDRTTHENATGLTRKDWLKWFHLGAMKGPADAANASVAANGIRRAELVVNAVARDA
jgi:hypothetical protein